MKSPTPRSCRLFIFDLDGTLIDSRADITSSLNLMLARMRLRPLHESRVADFVGSGVLKLVERALREITGHVPESDLVESGILLFREEYGNHLLDRTRLCPGVSEALDSLSWASFAVVTNKPESFSRQILAGLGIENRFCTILGGDSVQKRKPHPEALFQAMASCRASRTETAMIGDSAVDIEAGRAAGVTTCGVLGGFRPKEELEAAGCDLIIESLLELPRYFHPPSSRKSARRRPP
jgi:phosphoglycolate phosphatase